MADHELDCRRLLCPMPVIKTQNRIREMSPGDRLTVICTDPGAVNDIPAWCRVHGHTLVSTEQDGREYRITVQVDAP